MCLLGTALLLADLSSLPALLGVIALVAIGLGAVIFVHELGHFLVAKACGVKCEKFMIGFDIGGYKLSRKWGETEYGIGILPLGGYVKMLGQDDDPAHIAEQLKKSEVAETSPDAVEVHGPGGETYHVDRRSYLAKSVPQRMAIISAGVIMNVIFAFIFAVIAYGMGVKYMPSIVSETIPGSPAWRAGLEPGDEIVKLGERTNPTFVQLKGGVTLGDLDNGIPIVVHRAADGEDVELLLKPEQNGGGLATIGILNARTLKLLGPMPVATDSPAANATQIEPPPSADEEQPAGLKAGDQIVRVGDSDVKDFRAFAAELARAPQEPLRVTVRRGQHASGERADAKAEPANKSEQELTFEVGVRKQQRLGLIMKMGPVVALQANRPAAEAGIKVGDVITAIDGQSLAAAKSFSDWQPDTIAEKMRIAAVAGQQVAVTVERDGKSMDLSVTPQVPTEYSSLLPDGAPAGVPSLGLAYQIGNEVVGTIEGSPAAEAKIEPGDLVQAVEFVRPAKKDEKKAEPIAFNFVPPPASRLPAWLRNLFGIEEAPAPAPRPYWPVVFDTLQFVPPGTTVQITLQRGDEKLNKSLAPVAVDGLFVADRGFQFDPVERVRRAGSFSEQVQYGWDETSEALGMVFRFLKKIGTQVPVTALGGPITIAKAAGYSAYDGLPALLIFLTMLSANLAVLNFLPIPLLDGGHMAFLAYEGVRGRPASERFVVALHTIGFVFIVSLMLFVVFLDLGWIDRRL
ncbi:MAG: site-2 protease family protein [Pirellulales bacterium]